MLDKDKTREVVLTVGIPASGKSTWAREKAIEIDALILERDEIREQLFKVSRSEYKYTKAREKEVTEVQMQWMKEALLVGTPVIIADTNLNEKTRKSIFTEVIDYCTELDVAYTINIKTFDIPLKEAIDRNRKRLHTVPEAVMISMEKKMRQYLGKYVHDHSNPEKLPECILVDIDGTIADMAGKRHPFEWEKVGGDLPKGYIISMVELLIHDFFEDEGGKPEVIFMSGRDGVGRPKTCKWLFDNIPSYVPDIDKLYMRPKGDNRPDTVIKEELFNNHIKGKYHVQMIFDDRKCMVQHWQSMGFNVLDVGNGVSDF